MKRIKERRYTNNSELRADGDEQSRTISGYAAVFDSDSLPIGGRFIERIAPGAFAKTIQEYDQRMLWNHDDNIVLGRRSAKTLRLSEDATGLRVEAALPNSPAGDNALESIRRGDVSQMSFQFEAIRDLWEKRDDGKQIRTLLEVKLYETSPVAFPAYEATSVDARAIMESRGVNADDDSNEENERSEDPEQIAPGAAPMPESEGSQPSDSGNHSAPTDGARSRLMLKIKLKNLIGRI